MTDNRGVITREMDVLFGAGLGMLLAETLHDTFTQVGIVWIAAALMVIPLGVYVWKKKHD